MVSASEIDAGPARHTARNVLLEELTRGRPICMHSGSSSMRPQIIPGDILSIEPVSRNQLQRGDVVLMADGDEWTVHRLLATRLIAGKVYALTRGDAVNRLDELLPIESILGKVVKARRNDRETILKSAWRGRLMARLSLAKLQGLDQARRLVNILRRKKRTIWRKEDKKPDLDALLLQCSLPATNNSAELFQAIATTEGWEQFIKKAEEEGLSGLIYFNCREQIAKGLVPPEVGRSLKNNYLTTLARSTIFLAKLEQIARALAGLDFIVLKGAFLAQHVYPSPGLRGFSDIDILVKQADLDGIDLRLSKIGYLPAPAEAGFATLPRPPESRTPAESGRRRETHRPAFGIAGSSANSTAVNYYNSLMYYSAGAEIAIDIHWCLLNSMVSNYIRTTMDIGEIWQAARSSTGASLDLCPDHLIIHLAWHALHHSFERLILLRDIAEVIIRFGDALDWNRLVGECRKFNLARPVFYSLLLVSRKTNVPVPAAALEALRPARLGRAERLFISLALRGQRYPGLCHLAYFDSMPSVGQKIRFVLRIIFPCREVMVLTYGQSPDKIGPGIYILRLSHGIGYLSRVILDHARRMVRR